MTFTEFIKNIIKNLFSHSLSQKRLPPPPSLPKKKEESDDVWVLSIDGGGIRGLISAYVLEALSESLNKKNGNNDIADYFDLVAGTSTGGLIALCLTKKDPLSISEITSMYLHKNEIFFPHPKSFFERLLKEKYSINEMENFFKSIFKDDTFSSLKNNTLIMSYDINSSLPLPLSKETTPNILLKDASRATTAAPTFYPPLNLKINDKEYSLIDGGVVANNPVIWAYAKAKALYPKRKNIHILSIGNFRKKPTFNADSGSFSWIDITKGNLPIQTLYHSASNSNSDALAKMLPDLDYIRIEYKNDKEEGIKMDDNSPLTINRLTMMGKNLVETNKGTIDNIADKLICHKKAKFN